MAEEQTTAKKLDAPGDPKDKQKETEAGKESEQDVGGRFRWVMTSCPHCYTRRTVVVVHQNADWYECGHCNRYYTL